MSQNLGDDGSNLSRIESNSKVQAPKTAPVRFKTYEPGYMKIPIDENVKRFPSTGSQKVNSPASTPIPTRTPTRAPTRTQTSTDSVDVDDDSSQISSTNSNDSSNIANENSPSGGRSILYPNRTSTDDSSNNQTNNQTENYHNDNFTSHEPESISNTDEEDSSRLEDINLQTPNPSGIDDQNDPIKPTIDFSNDDHNNDIQSSTGTNGKIITIFELLNSMLGAGILSVPSTFVNTGIILSIILLIFMTALSYYCTCFCLKLCKAHQTYTYADLTKKMLGKIASYALTILNLIFLGTSMVAYLILAGDIIVSWFDFGGKDISGRWPRAIAVLIYSFAVPIVLTIPPKVSILRYIASITVFAVVFFVIAMSIKCGTYCVSNQKINPTCRLWKLDSSFFSSLSIYGLTFALPAVVFPVIREYKNPDLKKREKVTFFGLFICCILCSVPGFTGYMIFGDATDGNILNSFESNDLLIFFCRLCFFIIVSCAYPMLSQTVCSLWSFIVYKVDDHHTLTGSKRALILVLNNIFPLVLAMLLPTAKPILSIGGSLGGYIVNFVYPCLMYAKHLFSRKKWYDPSLIILYVLIAFGVITSVIATYQAVLDAIASFK